MGLLALGAPYAGTPFAAYAPAIFECADVIAGTSGYVPAEVIYCDVYINGNYFKSTSSTSAEMLYYNLQPWFRKFTFDVQTILQEALRSIPPPLEAFQVVQDTKAICTFRLSYRKGYKNSNGVVVFSDTAPIQASMDQQAIPGSGTQTPTYLALNATQQHEEEEELPLHLATLRSPGVTNVLVWPLSGRPDKLYLVGRQQPDFFPFFCSPFAFNDNVAGAGVTGCNFRIDYKLAGDQGTYTDITSSITQPGQQAAIIALDGGGMYHIPTGIVQLRQLTWDNLMPAQWDGIKEYRLTIEKTGFGGSPTQKIIATPWMGVDNAVCTNGQRILFLNRYGGWDGLNFELIDEALQTKSEGWEKRKLPFKYFNGYSLQDRKSDYGNARLSIRSNERVTARTHKYPYSANGWIKEVFGAPIGYVLGSLTNTSKRTLFPIVIADATFPVKKSSDRWDNMVVLDYAPANENIHQRL